MIWPSYIPKTFNADNHLTRAAKGSNSMPLYEYDTNADNMLAIDESANDRILVGTDNVIANLTSIIQQHHARTSTAAILALDGNYGVQWDALLTRLSEAAERAGLVLEPIHINTVFKSQEEIDAYKAPFITNDPSFGYENSTGRIQHIMDMEKVNALRAKLEKARECRTSTLSAVVVFGSGAAIEELNGVYDYRCFFEMTVAPIMQHLWAGTLVPFGNYKPRKDYTWKELYYVDFNLLANHKWYLLEHMDFFVDAVDLERLTLIPKKEYDLLITTLLKNPIKQIRVFMPGPWGGYRFKDVWEVEGLANSAWNNIASPKLDLRLDIGKGKKIRLPSINLLQYGDKLVGSFWDKEVPKWWPIIAAIDDGYFPDETTPLERTSMPSHSHPPTDYVRRKFNEQFGRYETYYIVEAYENAATIMGFRDDADLEEWERKCREADKNKAIIPDWKEYVKIWNTSVGDLFLIPPGTTHGHGGRQMVLELDTTVNTSTCEYSFFMHDYGRNSWDDNSQAMTGKPMKLHCEHGFNVEKWRREKWVAENLRAKPKVVKWTQEYCMEQYSTLPEMPFHIERFHFTKRAENDTMGRWMQIVTLTVGSSVTIRSIENPEFQTTIEWLQAAVIPASYGAYEFVNNNEGQCTVVQIRMKKG